MARNDARRLSKTELLAKRKEVIRLYKNKIPIMKIVEESALSWPAVNAAIKLYEAGGIKGLVPMQRGRKPGAGRALSEDQENEIRTILYRKRPWQVGIRHTPLRSLWNREAVRLLVQQQCDITLTAQGISKYLRRWGIPQVKQNQRPIARCTKEIQDWLNGEYQQLLERCEQTNAVIYWVRRFPMAIANTGHGKWPRKMAFISVVDNHRKEHWMILKGNFSQEKQIRFLNSLIIQARQHVILIRNNSNHYTDRRVATWIQQNPMIDIYPPLLPKELRKKTADQKKAEQARQELHHEREGHRRISTLLKRGKF